MKALHWADQMVRKIISEKGDKKSYTVAAGITPSGVVHIGNFREIMTVDLIARALKSAGKKVRFIYSWDDYDVFRKVPKGMPKQGMLKDNLRKAIVDVPDPHGQEESYARFNEVAVERDIAKVGIFPEYLYQATKYRAGDYVKGIKVALKNSDNIRMILNEFRKDPLKDGWLPLTGFCPICGKDNLTFHDFNGKNCVKMDCSDCASMVDVDLDNDHFLKLPWRVDWPMRWSFEKVDFEPSGKDHQTQGGSMTTAKRIVEEVYDYSEPSNFMYNFISIKGVGGKISSSLGNVITLGDCLRIYEPAMVRWLFAGTRPGAEFNISFDLDVLKIYEDFDKCERIYYKEQSAKNDKEFANQKSIYELSLVNPKNVSQKMPFQPSFRHMTNIVQIFDKDIKKIVRYYLPDNILDEERIIDRANRAINWLNDYAPEEMVFSVQKRISDKVKKSLSSDEKSALIQLADSLKKGNFDDKSLFEEFYSISKSNGLEPKDFFRSAYNVLINKVRGPKLAGFILEIGEEVVCKLFYQLK